MTMLETEEEKKYVLKKRKKKNQQEEANLKVFTRSAGEWIFLVQAKKLNLFFFPLVLPGAMCEVWGKHISMHYNCNVS